MQLKEVMKTEVITTNGNETVTDAAKRMRAANVGVCVDKAYRSWRSSAAFGSPVYAKIAL